VDAVGLMDYGARFYDPALGRFVSADSIVPEPGNPQALNRYAYVLGNPLRYVDPSGHEPSISGFGMYVLGFVTGWAEVNSLGYTNVSGADDAFDELAVSSSDFASGRVIGNVIAGVQGVAEFTEGMMVGVGGTTVCLSTAGVGCLVALTGGAVMAHGSAVAAASALFLQQNASFIKLGSDADFDDGYAEAPDHWAEPSTLNDHAIRHGDDFGAKSAVDYANKANEFFKSRSSASISRFEKDGQLYMYQKKTNTLGVYTSDGKTVTYMKPDRGVRYWHDLLDKLTK
jgi:RHS repeat-associated protein